VATDGAGARAPEDTAARWVADLAAQLSVPGMTLHTQAGVLALARDVAHATERKYAPLAAFVAGRFVEVRRSEGVDEATALRELNDMVSRILENGESTQ
jgi:Domain of unknown function (DUF6457)